MTPPENMLDELADADQVRLEWLLWKFDQSWTPEGLDAQMQNLPAGDARLQRVTLVELVKIDMERQWMAGNQCTVEGYLKRFPQLGTKATVPIELLQSEYEVRQQCGVGADLSDFGGRFPGRVDQLKSRLRALPESSHERLAARADADTSRENAAADSQSDLGGRGPELPERFGRYRILRKLGEGAMGAVYLAHDTELDRKVALKVPAFADAHGDELAARFYQEARAAAALSHRNICPVYDIGEIEGTHYISMAFVEGRPLTHYTQSEHLLSEQEIAALVRKLALAVGQAHSQGVVHRDLKPANVMIDAEQEPVIMDFGLARQLDKGDQARLTKSGIVMGSPAYMSPEQVEGAVERIGPESDVYSLGVILYELLTGKPPFQGSVARVLAKILSEEPARPSELRPGLPPPLEAICLKMMAKRIEDRYASMREVIADLEAYQKSLTSQVTDTLPLSASPASGEETDADRAPPAPGRKPSGDDPAPDERLQADLRATSTQLRTGRARKLQLTRQPRLVASIGAAVALTALVVFAVIISVKTPWGTILVRVDQPDAQVSVDRGKIKLEARGEEPVEIKLAKGEHTLKVTKGGFQTHTERFKIKSGAREAFDVTLVPLGAVRAESRKPKADVAAMDAETVSVDGTPPPDQAAWKALLPADAPAAAVAPFAAAAAKRHQEAWADYLEVPIEKSVDLGDGVKLAMVLIPPGEFLMGSTAEEQLRLLKAAEAAGDQWAIDRISNEGPQHRVRITRPFRLGRHEVTRAQFRQFVAETGYTTEAERDGKGGRGLIDAEGVEDPHCVWDMDPGFEQTDGHPVVNVSWKDATAFCRWLSEEEGVECVLPTEAQWEYACRAGTTTLWHCGPSEAELQEYEWFNANSGGRTHPVGLLRPNGFGLYDVHGNALEWCADRWGADYYERSPTDDPSGPLTSPCRAGRGGSWDHLAWSCRSASRGAGSPGHRFSYLGFRVASVLRDGVPRKPKADQTEVKAERAKPQAARSPDPGAWKALLPADAPAPAIAPFDEAQAQEHQRAWAEYLEVPVEQNFDLGDSVMLAMVLIPPGEFHMGSSPEEQVRFLEEPKAANNRWAIRRIPTEGPQHRVRITRPFRLSRHEVTVGQFRQFVDQTAYKTNAERDGQGGRGFVDGRWVQDPRFVWSADPGYEQTDEHPVVNVSWNDATAFCQWLSKKERAAFILPTEAQWEYACRGGTTTAWYCGDSDGTLEEYGWFSKNSGGTTHPVGQLKPNGWSLYEMHGNVWEWCADYWATDYYAQSPSNDPAGPTTGSYRVIRGGSWGDHAGFCRSAYRHCRSPEGRHNTLGFRVASVSTDE